MSSNLDSYQNKNAQPNETQSFIVSVQPKSTRESGTKNSQSCERSAKHEPRKRRINVEAIVKSNVTKQNFANEDSIMKLLQH